MSEDINKEIEQLKKIISGYENVLKLNEQELENAEEIIKMYENIVEYSRAELKTITETAKAQEQVSAMSRNELIDAFQKIESLESENEKIKEQRCQS